VFRANTFSAQAEKRANRGPGVRAVTRALAFAAVLPAAAICHAQSQDENNNYRTIPDWVKIDRVSLTEASYSPGPQEKQPSLYSFSSHQQTAWPEKESWLRQRYVRMAAADAYKIAANAAPASYQQSEPPHNDAFHPIVNQPNAWRVTVPNLRKNVAKVMLLRNF
jgi:hypothetical protein